MQRANRRWLLIALLAAASTLAACTISNSPDGWARPLETELPDDRSVILARTGDDRLAAIDLDSRDPVVWEFPGLDANRLVEDDNVFPGIATEIDAKGFYGAPRATGPHKEEFVLADHDEGIVYAVRRDGTSARVILDTEDRVIAGLVVDPDVPTVVYVAASEGRVYAVNTDDPPENRDDIDRLRWPVIDLADKVWGTPALTQTERHGQVLLVPTTGGEVRALRTDGGGEAWSFQAEAGIASDIVVAGGLAYVGGFDRRFYAVDVETGQPRWTQVGDHWFWTRPLVNRGTVYVGDLDGKIWAWEAANGAARWAAPYDADERIRAQPVLTPAGELFIVTREGHLLALDPVSGAKIWASRDADGLKVQNRVLATPLVQANGRVLLSDDQGELWEARVGVDSICPVFPRSSTDCRIPPPADAGSG